MSIKICSFIDEDGLDLLSLSGDGTPRVVWDERRPNGSKRVNCSIECSDNNELLFATDGCMFDDPMYRSRPWQHLVAFKPVPASQLYYSSFDNRLRQEFINQSAFLRLLLPDDAVVMTAEFSDDHPSIPMHLNYGIGTPTEVMELHNALHRRFILNRQTIVETLFNGDFVCPMNDFYDPKRSEADNQKIKDVVAKRNHQKGFFGKLFG